jgi:hypothetical protein
MGSEAAAWKIARELSRAVIVILGMLVVLALEQVALTLSSRQASSPSTASRLRRILWRRHRSGAALRAPPA